MFYLKKEFVIELSNGTLAQDKVYANVIVSVAEKTKMLKRELI